MKLGCYLVMLIHDHMHESMVLPPNELAQIKEIYTQVAGKRLPIHLVSRSEVFR